MIRKSLNKFIVLIVISLFVTSFFGQFETATSSEPALADWEAHPMWIAAPDSGSSSPTGYSPSQMRTAYNLPSLGGAGTTIAIIDAYDTLNVLDYFNYFSDYFGLPNNSTGNFIVYKMSQSMGTDSSWAMETCLDVEWAHAIAPNAKILLVEATTKNGNDLLDAVDYATSQPGVISVSMSWGGSEFSSEASYDNHFSKPGITCFASSGDTGAVVSWPAVSSKIVGVGGTSLTLNPDGSVVSETGWSGSGGGVSAYVAVPDYQSNFGLTFGKRAVPDVSYSADSNTGVSVYNDGWWKVGGTSAGSPQWAAIHALGLSTSNANLYARASSAYLTHFRDITSGSNGAYSATTGYDLVTGLGSPITTNYGTTVTVSPTSGPPSGSVGIYCVGFTIGSSVNISYQTSLNSTWLPIVNNYNLSQADFTYTISAPDLLQNNIANDTTPQNDTLTFKVVDNSNGHSYTSTNSYAEMRRGLTKVGNANAFGLFGNNTDLSRTVFTNINQSITLSGNWFNPGSATILWDATTSLGTATVDVNGTFSTSVLVPTTSAGQHSIIIRDAHSDFKVNITRLPMATDNYTDAWRTANFTVNLTSDFGGTQINYRINGGATNNVTANGQPRITVEGVYPLEYWLVWDVYGTGSMELAHSNVTVKLDKTAPNGTITTSSNTTSTPTITLTLSASDATSGVALMHFSNDSASWSPWEAYATSKTWNLTGGDGQKTVYAQYQDNAGLNSTVYNCNITLSTSQPTPTPTNSPTPTLSPTSLSENANTTNTTSPTPISSPAETPSSTNLTTPTSVEPANNPTILQPPETIVIIIALFIFMWVITMTRKPKPSPA